MKKACLIIPYYGKWPTYLPIYLESCKANGWLDILFFTDIEIIPPHPANVSFINFPLIELENRVAKLLGITKYVLPNSYKLCDLRPLYGAIFHTEIKNYQYWAFGDCDLVYGDLLSFIKHDLDKNIDVISFNEQRNSGSLLLLKNNHTINNIYTYFEDYTNLIQSTDFKGMDEVCHQWNEIDKLRLPKNCLTYWIAELTNRGNITSSYQNRIAEKIESRDLVKYANNRVFFNHTEIAYFHYVCNKDKPIFSFPKWKFIPNTFYINETGFYLNERTASYLKFIKKTPTLFVYYLKKTPNFIMRKLASRLHMNSNQKNSFDIE